jgi:MoaA/NifB/PqqE/SkfB family radical SAM enzyme
MTQIDGARPAIEGASSVGRARPGVLAVLRRALADSATQALRRRIIAAPGLIPLCFFRKIPPVLVIDVTNSCNLRCPICPVTFGMTRPRGMMTLALFQSIIDDLAKHRLRPAVYFNFSGEPTLNPALPGMVAYAARNGHETFISTNATKVGPALAEDLIRAGLSRINLCLDGFTREAHEGYRVRSNFEQTKSNIATFAAVRRTLGSKTPTLVLQTLLTSFSENHVDDIVAWAAEVGLDRVRFKTFSLGSHGDAARRSSYRYYLPTRGEWRRNRLGRERSFCNVPLRQAVVFWDGDLGLCCIDYDQMIKLPNAKERGFVAAFRSEPAARARRAGFLKQHAVCQSCSYSNAENMGFYVDLASRPAASRT